MTVKELINQLEKMPQDAKVIYFDGDNGWCEPKVEFTTKYLKNPYSASASKYVYGKFVDLSAG